VPSAALNPASAGAAVDAQAFEREADRMKEMGEVLASLRAQSAQTQRLLLEMRSELAQAQASRYRNPLVYVLLALTGVLLLVVLLLWRSLRQARQAQWWSEEQAEAMAAQRAHAPRSTRLPRRGLLDDGADAEDEDDDDDLPVLTEVDEAGPTHAPAPRRGALDAVGFDRTLERSVNAEELFDVQQKAEFFMSLGKHEQAIGVLRDHVSANPGTSALVYLDLLNILHALGRTEDYARQAREFEERFNAEVPPFDAFDRQGRGLDHYPSVLARISDLWPGAGTAELIEELVFRHPGVRGEVFDLLAYQELLLLHAVARDIADHPAHVFARAHGAHAAPHFVAGGPAPGAVGEDETVPMPYLPHVDRAAVPANMPEVDMDISALDRTAFQTLRAPVENLPPAPAPAPIDPHVIDFNPFDPDDDELKPGRFSIKR